MIAVPAAGRADKYALKHSNKRHGWTQNQLAGLTGEQEKLKCL
jgi:hypothetical protein